MTDSARKAIHTDQAPAAIGPYSQALEVDGWVYCSGQIPIIPEDGSIARGIEDQAHQALKNLGEVLQAAGCGFGDVVKTQVYLSDMADFEVVNRVYAQFFTEPFPARACIQAAALPKGVDVEIDAVARKRENR
jgi:2-iminobutanoate/2-iminopropanoate deaminase